MTILQLRCKSEKGTQRLGNNLLSTSTINELKEAIQTASGIKTTSQRIMVGYPPKPLDLSNSSATLGDLNIRSGDTFTIVNTETKSIKSQDCKESIPEMKRREVPADNSCLFYSVYFALHGHLSESSYPEAKKYRADIANVVNSNPEKYTEGFLGKSPMEYSVWIQCDTSWGGGIELSILSEIYQIEIAAIDIQTVRPDIYGQDNNYATRIFLLYDGIHYDPMYLDPDDSKFPIQTIFPATDDMALTKALKVADDSKSARQYTDVSNFTLRCLTCQTRLTGQKSAQKHAKETGHGNFGEI